MDKITQLADGGAQILNQALSHEQPCYPTCGPQWLYEDLTLSWSSSWGQPTHRHRRLMEGGGDLLSWVLQNDWSQGEALKIPIIQVHLVLPIS